jgi:hypothetical protein
LTKITLAAGGSGIIGSLNLYGRRVVAAPAPTAGLAQGDFSQVAASMFVAAII